jgi:hypothetical protein
VPPEDRVLLRVAAFFLAPPVLRAVVFLRAELVLRAAAFLFAPPVLRAVVFRADLF